MKFGKSIRAEARSNRGLSFINFKSLKRLLKKSIIVVPSHDCEPFQDDLNLFLEALESELNKVDESFWKELESITVLKEGLQQRLPHLDIYPDPETFTDMTFEQLLSHLQTSGGLDSEIPDSPPRAKTSAALCEFCVNLGKISARCKRLRRCVLWNAVAVVKILKKRMKLMETSHFKSIVDIETAAQVLSRQGWYRCPALSQIISVVEITTDQLMQQLTQRPPNRDSYQCPICLDVVIDPVCLKTCGHRFCWACLCMAYCERPEGTLERCPCCRAAFPLDPEAFEIDGILSRFLRTFFPVIQSKRVDEQKENIRQRLEALNLQTTLTTAITSTIQSSKFLEKSNFKSEDLSFSSLLPLSNYESRHLNCFSQDVTTKSETSKISISSDIIQNNNWLLPYKKKMNDYLSKEMNTTTTTTTTDYSDHQRQQQEVKNNYPNKNQELLSVNESSCCIDKNIVDCWDMWEEGVIDNKHTDEVIFKTLPAPVRAVIDSLLGDNSSSSLKNEKKKKKLIFGKKDGHRLVSMLEIHFNKNDNFINNDKNISESYNNNLEEIKNEKTEMMLPELLAPSIPHTKNNLEPSLDVHYEAIDDDDDAIEEEFLRFYNRELIL